MLTGILQHKTSFKTSLLRKSLVLGCGDIRSCFYSLWKNFDVKGRPRFDGVHFVLNDISAAVLARNILFLYLCIQMPEEEGAVRSGCGLFGIVMSYHYDMLNDSLKALCSFSEAWSDKSNPLYSLVKFVSHTTRNEIWSTWLDQSIGFHSVEKMHSSQLAKLMMHCARVPLPIMYRKPHFIALIHKCSSSDAQYLCNEAMSGKDVHIFDCMNGNVEDKVLKLHFFAPIKYTKQDYQVTLGLTFMTEQKNQIVTALQTSSMKSLQVPFMPYSFFEMNRLPQAGQKANPLGISISLL